MPSDPLSTRVSLLRQSLRDAQLEAAELFKSMADEDKKLMTVDSLVEATTMDFLLANIASLQLFLESDLQAQPTIVEPYKGRIIT